MKKTRFIALVLAVSLMIMGSGFALWSETLVVNSKVNTGNLDVRFTGCKATTTEWMEDSGVSVLHKRINLTANKMYPGATAEFVIEVTNKGTVPARYTDYTIENENGDDGLLQALNVKLDTKGKGKTLELTDVEVDGKHGGGGGGHHPKPEDIVIEPNDSKEFVLKFTLPEGVTEFQNKNISMDFMMNWVQYNNSRK